jgi:hypothetical protein
VAISVAGVMIANQAGGAKKLKGFAAVIVGMARVAKAF